MLGDPARNILKHQSHGSQNSNACMVTTLPRRRRAALAMAFFFSTSLRVWSKAAKRKGNEKSYQLFVVKNGTVT